MHQADEGISVSDDQEALMLAALGFSAAKIEEHSKQLATRPRSTAAEPEEPSVPSEDEKSNQNPKKVSMDSRRRNVSFGARDECASLFVNRFRLSLTLP